MKFKVSKIAEMMGQKPQSINTWGRRGKVLIIDGVIDLDVEPNKTFFKEKGLIANPKISLPDKPKEESEEIEIKQSKRYTGNSSENVSASQKLNILKVAKLKEDYEFARLRNEKIRGELISTDIVGRATAEVILRYKSTFVQQADELIRDLCNENSISNKKRIEFLSRLTLIANEASERANMEAKIAVENSISDSLSLTKA